LLLINLSLDKLLVRIDSLEIQLFIDIGMQPLLTLRIVARVEGAPGDTRVLQLDSSLLI
jgi:hypothetical protein